MLNAGAETGTRYVREQLAAAQGRRWRDGLELHTEMEGTPVVIVYDSRDTGGILHVIFDLGYAEIRRGLLLSMLESNAIIRPAVQAYFGVNPLLRSIIYRVDVPKERCTDAAALTTLLLSELKFARDELASSFRPVPPRATAAEIRSQA